MLTESQLHSTIESFQGSGKSFAEFIAELFKGKMVEIYLGDSYEEVSTEQISVSYPAVFCGEVIGAYKECLVIKTAYIFGKANKRKDGNLMCISERAIRALNEIGGDSSIDDVFMRSRNSAELV